MRIKDCKHLPKKFANPKNGNKCEENHVCMQGLRVCLTCGYTGCCDSCLQHERIHANDSGHQVMAYFPADENSPIWCYLDDDYLEPDENHNLSV